MSVWLLAGLAGIIIGGGAVEILHLALAPRAETASVVEAARAPEATDAQARLAVAQTPAVTLAVEAAVRPDATPYVQALAGYALCLSASQGKSEGSAAYGCQARGEVLDAAQGAGR